MKKIALVATIIGVILLAGYGYLRVVLKAKDFKPAHAQQSGIVKAVDVRPAIIAKLKQVVKDGSNGLYGLSIDSLDIDILQSKVTLLNITLIPDFNILKRFDSLQKAPDDVFKISLSKLKIDGIGLEELLSQNTINLKELLIADPTIEIFHKKRTYNISNAKDTLTLYQRISKQIKSIAIQQIAVTNGTIINHNLSSSKSTTYKDVGIQVKNLLIDSVTQYDKNRFLFAKEASLSFKNLALTTNDKLYDFKIASVFVAATKHTVYASNISLQPYGGSKALLKKVGHMQEVYNINIPSVQFNTINWWQLVNNESIEAGDVTIKNGAYKIYLDRSLPPDGRNTTGKYPHQLLMKLPLKVDIARLHLKNNNIVYEEFNPASGKSGKVYIDQLNGTVTNITNIPGKIKQNGSTTVSVTANFLHKIPVTAVLKFNLNQYKKGTFTTNLNIGAFDGLVLKPVAQPLGMVSIKTGTVEKGTAAITGNNNGATIDGLLLYHDLHIEALKNGGGKLEAKHLTSFIANAFIIKNDNPSKNAEPRKKSGYYKRNPRGTFFNLIFKTLLVGVLKTIGAPEKLANAK